MRLPGRPAADLLYEARARERAACIPEAIERFEAAIATAERTGERAVLAEALRRLAVVRHHRNETAAAWELCNRSYTVAGEQGSDFLAAEALNTLGGLDLRSRKLRSRSLINWRIGAVSQRRTGPSARCIARRDDPHSPSLGCARPSSWP